MARPDRGWIGGALFTVAMVALIALAIPDVVSHFFLIVMAAVAGATVGFYLMFPGSRLFSIAFANSLAIYACMFVFFVEANFGPVSEVVRPIGFVLPILAFLAGAWRQRRAISDIVLAEEVRSARRFTRALLWLVPVFAIGAATFLLPVLGLGGPAYDAIFLVAMVAIAGIVAFVSVDVAIFLADTGLLFEQFFGRLEDLLVPGFAFLTFYSLNIIIFACLYRIVDRFTGSTHFLVNGHPGDLSFADALYFSVITLSTVGYGEIVPASDVARVIVAVQVVSGVLLLLFGFSEIITYSRERRERGRRREGP